MFCTNEGFLINKIASRHNIIRIDCAFDRTEDLNGIRGEDGREPFSTDLSDAVMMREGSTRSQDLVARDRLQFLENVDGLHDVHGSIIKSEVKVYSCSSIVYLCHSSRNEIMRELASCKLNKRMLTLDNRFGITLMYQCILP